MSTQSPAFSRRALLALAALPAGLARPAFAQGGGAASALVKSTGDQLVAIVNGPGTLAEKQPKLRRVIEANIDVDEIARFVLGRFWRTATPEQQKQYTLLYHDVLILNISGNLGDYNGVKFTLGTTHARDDGEHVMTIVERPNNPPTNVEWVVASTAKSPKIIDVIAEGTSMRLTQRSDYSSYLSRNNNNVQALIDAMRQQAAQNK
jgi:phospholipid transport system substrate-binding protein